MSISIVLADDHTLVREGLRFVLESEPDLHVIGEAGDGLTLLELVDRLKPDVLVVDIVMPHLNGLEAAREVQRRSPQTRIVVISMYDMEGYVVQALKYGVMGYVLKNATADHLARAVRDAAAGKRYLSPPLSELALEAYLSRARESVVDRYDSLTARERQVLQLAAEGFSNSEIGARLGISGRTVEVHRSHLMRKLHLHTQTELIRYALERGLVEARLPVVRP